MFIYISWSINQYEFLNFQSVVPLFPGFPMCSVARGSGLLPSAATRRTILQHTATPLFDFRFVLLCAAGVLEVLPAKERPLCTCGPSCLRCRSGADLAKRNAMLATQRLMSQSSHPAPPDAWHGAGNVGRRSGGAGWDVAGRDGGVLLPSGAGAGEAEDRDTCIADARGMRGDKNGRAGVGSTHIHTDIYTETDTNTDEWERPVSVAVFSMDELDSHGLVQGKTTILMLKV